MTPIFFFFFVIFFQVVFYKYPRGTRLPKCSADHIDAQTGHVSFENGRIMLLI